MGIVAEVLAYVGATLALAGVILVVVRAWPDLATWVRVSLPAVITAVLAGIGFAVPERDAIRVRLRAVLWLGASGSATVLGVVLARDVYGSENGATVALGASATAFIVSAALWRWQRRPVQQAATLIALAVALGTAVAVVAEPGIPGFILWPLGVGYLMLGTARRTPDRLLTEAIGGAVLFAATVEFASQWQAFGAVAMPITGLLLLTVALSRWPIRTTGDAVVLGVAGAFILVQGAPNAVGYFAQAAGVVTGLIVWGVGATAVLIGATRRTRIPRVIETAGGFVVVIGAAVTGAQAQGFATIFGLATAVGLLLLGLLPGRILLTLCGSVGLLVFVPWAISWYFPGENRAPVLVAISGLVVLAVALLLGRSTHRFREELRR